MKSEPIHPGEFIRQEVFPKGLSVTKAAKLIGVGRPALSNMLNGNSSLSPEMASKIEAAFGGVTANTLLDLQAQYDATRLQKGIKSAPKTYVVPFLELKANDIIGWATDNLSARARLAVFLRTLVNSTGIGLEQVDFPGNDDSQRRGNDGYVKTETGNPWIPGGESIWEFGVNKKPKGKADGDFDARLDPSTKAERLTQTFVFVTPRRWAGKTDWSKTQREKGEWKDVRAYDASDLEQWLEQSIPAQAWFAAENNISAQGVRSLENCWSSWGANCDPTLVPELFEQYIQAARRKISEVLKGSDQCSFKLSADSTTEALAFLSCVLSPSDQTVSAMRDKCVVFSEVGQLRKLAVRKAGFVAIIASREVEKELGELEHPIQAIVIQSRANANFNSDFRLGTISHDFFTAALKKMGFNSDETQRLERESGRSATVLRRRLSNLEAIRLPSWSNRLEISNLVIPILFAGAWDSQNKADQAVLQFLADDDEAVSYKDIEREFSNLYMIDDSPVWAAGTHRGIVSKVDLLFAIQHKLVRADLERFLNVAKELVLSEKDPSLDLAEEERWMAGVYGKVRENSSALRNGITETLVLLAVHGSDLFKRRTGFDIKLKIEGIVRSLLEPVTAGTLEEHSQAFPMLAEAAPDVILDILESDLTSQDSGVLGLLRPTSGGIFGSCPRSGLLWALESLAWDPVHLPRVVLILGKLSMQAIDDNWANKPIGSLQAIFRAWIPQTEASLKQRISTLDLLVKQVPEIGWQVCIEQFDGRSTVGQYSYKPRWRNDGNGFGEPVSHSERSEFCKHCLDRALNWKVHSAETLGGLVERHFWLTEEVQEKIWKLIERWGDSAADEEKCDLREKIRTNALTRRAHKRTRTQNNFGGSKGARRVCDRLAPSDVILKHKWLFVKQWVDESMDELEDDEFDYTAHENRIEEKRYSALEEVKAERGLAGILDMAEVGDTAEIIGVLLIKLCENDSDLLSAIVDVTRSDEFESSENRQRIIRGALDRVIFENNGNLLKQLFDLLSHNETRRALPSLPFSPVTWDLLEESSEENSGEYWRNVIPRWMFKSAESNDRAIEKLIEFGRPKAAFYMIQHRVEEVSPQILAHLLKSIPRSSESVDEYQLDSYSVGQSFEHLNGCEEISSNEMAELEFLYIELLERDEYPIPNLEKMIASDGEFLVHVIVMAYKRSDENEDPEGFWVQDPEIRRNRARAAHHLIENISGLPFQHLDDQDREVAIQNWVEKVKSGCKEFARLGVGESILGQLFSKTPVGKDGIWPGEIERNVLEEVISERMQDGVTMGLINQRGVHFRDKGGKQERELASKYEGWATALEFTHPQTAKALRKMVESYIREAEEQDDREAINDRLLH